MIRSGHVVHASTSLITALPRPPRCLAPRGVPQNADEMNLSGVPLAGNPAEVHLVCDNVQNAV
jgi:hypothetical protein